MIWRRACATGPCTDDVCWHEAVEATDDVVVVADAVRRIEDPIVRSAAVMGWIQRHGDTADRDAVLGLCAQLSGEDEQLCTRRLEAAHLR